MIFVAKNLLLRLIHFSITAVKILWLAMNKYIPLLILATILVFLLVGWVIEIAQKKKRPNILHEDEKLTTFGIDSFESGKKPIFVTGSSSITDSLSINGLLGFPFIKKYAHSNIHGDQRFLLIHGDPALALLSQMVLKGVYNNAMVPELFDPHTSYYTGSSAMTNLGACLAQLKGFENGGMVLIGQMQPEWHLLIDMANRKEWFSYAASPNLSFQSVGLFANWNSIIGENYYALGASTGNNLHRASLKVQDLLRIGIVLILIIGSLLIALGVL